MARRASLADDYFSWLYRIIGKQRRSYVKLARELHSYPFRWQLANDENRCEDGLSLRDLYIEEVRLDEGHLEVEYWYKSPCTMLEMMIGLAKRMDGITYDIDTAEDKTSFWFMELIKNLKLSRFHDDASRGYKFDPVQEAEICDTLCVTLDRQFGKSGTGSLFPLERPQKDDMRDIEIWYQMQRWLEEKYGQ